MKRFLPTLATVLALPSAALAVTPQEIGTNTCKLNPDAVGCGTKSILGSNSVFTEAIYIVIGVIGALSVLMIVIGGLRYVLSGGDSAGIRSAKDTIMYAVAGLIIAILAGAIVRFVIGAIG